MGKAVVPLSASGSLFLNNLCSRASRLIIYLVHQSPVLAQSPGGREPLSTDWAAARDNPCMFQLVRVQKYSSPEKRVSSARYFGSCILPLRHYRLA